jgi:hypothetical protein
VVEKLPNDPGASVYFLFSSDAKKARMSAGSVGAFCVLLLSLEGWRHPLDDNFVNKFSNDPASCEPISDHLPVSLCGSHGVTRLAVHPYSSCNKGISSFTWYSNLTKIRQISRLRTDLVKQMADRVSNVKQGILGTTNRLLSNPVLVSSLVGTHEHIFIPSRLLRVLKLGFLFEERRVLVTTGHSSSTRE